MNHKRIRQQFADTMVSVGQEDPDLVVLVGDMSHFLLQPFARTCPGRFYNIGICEAAIVSMAAGLSKLGFHPVVHTIAPFTIERAFEQLKLDFCYQRLSGNIVTAGGAFDYSNLGPTHHCYSDFALMKTLPFTQIVYPASCVEFDILFRQAYSNECLKLFRVPENQHGQQIDASLINFGKGIKIVEGKDITLIVSGPQLKNVIEARKELSNKGWDAEVIYIHTIAPLDLPLIRKSIEKTKRVLIVEEHNIFGGLAFDVIGATYDIRGLQFFSLGIKNFICDYGTYNDLCSGLGLSTSGIVEAICNNFKKGSI